MLDDNRSIGVLGADEQQHPINAATDRVEIIARAIRLRVDGMDAARSRYRAISDREFRRRIKRQVDKIGDALAVEVEIAS